MSYSYDFPRPALTVDIILYSYFKGTLQVLLIQRKEEPFAKKWALPGGFVEENETAGEAAARELKEETGYSDVVLSQLYTETGLNRDPRGRTVSIVYRGFYVGTFQPQAGDDAAKAKWFSLYDLPELAFDHLKLIKKSYTRLKENIINKPFGKELLGSCFKLSDLKNIACKILENEKTVDILIHRMVDYNIIVQRDTKGCWHFDEIKYMWHSAFGFIRF